MHVYPFFSVFLRQSFFLMLILIVNTLSAPGQESLKPAGITKPATITSPVTPSANALAPAIEIITEASISQKISEINQQIDIGKKNLEASKSVLSPELLELQNQQIQRQGDIALILNRQISALKKNDNSSANLKQITDQLEQIKANGPTEKPPYSYLLLDSLRNEQESEKSKKTSIEDTLKAIQTTLNQAEKDYEDKTNACRLAKEAAEKNQDKIQEATFTLMLHIAQLEQQAAKETVSLRELEMQGLKIDKSTFEIRYNSLDYRIAYIEKQTEFTEKDLKEQLNKQDNEISTITKERDNAKDSLERSKKSLSKAQDDLAKEPDSPILQEEEILRRYERDLYQDTIDIADKRITRIKEQQEVWNRRYQTINKSVSVERLQRWTEECKSKLILLDTEYQNRTANSANVRNDRLSLTDKLERYKKDPAVISKLTKQQQILQLRSDRSRDNNTNLETTRRLYTKLLNEINAQIQSWSYGEFIEYGWLKFNTVLNYPVWKIDEKNVMDIRKIVKALTYLIAGLILARVVSRLLAKILLLRFKVPEGACAAINALSYYIMFICVIMITLNAVSIPLTAFTFLGGALAIGVGFGSQNIISNFISGLILLAERPIKVGDQIDVDGTVGNVISIGARCTRVRSFSNVDILVPNSKLLENKIINLTHDDNITRTAITVGVAYGSDAREVFHMLKKVLDEHGLILKKPESFVVFTNFGDSSIEFTAYFWISLNQNSLIVKSDLRHRIYHMFSDSGIIFSYPQRDIHLDMTKPVDVRLLRPEETKSEHN